MSAPRDLSPKGIRDLAEENQTNISGISGGPLKGSIEWDSALQGTGEKVVITADGVEVELTMQNFAGGNSARTAAGKVDVDVGGGAGDSAADFLPVLVSALDLCVAAGDAVPFLYRRINGTKLSISAPWATTLTVTTEDAGLIVVEP